MPPDLLEQIQANDNVGKTRLAVFLAALVFLSSQLGINVADNLTASGVSAGLPGFTYSTELTIPRPLSQIDLASMFPRWMTIRRGAYFTALVSVLIQPWQLLNGSSVYLSVMGSYGVFLGPLTGLLIADYHIVRQRKLKLSHLYEATPETTYWFFHGFNRESKYAKVMVTRRSSLTSVLLQHEPSWLGYSASCPPSQASCITSRIRATLRTTTSAGRGCSTSVG